MAVASRFRGFRELYWIRNGHLRNGVLRMDPGNAGVDVEQAPLSYCRTLFLLFRGPEQFKTTLRSAEIVDFRKQVYLIFYYVRTDFSLEHSFRTSQSYRTFKRHAESPQAIICHTDLSRARFADLTISTAVRRHGAR